jgi:hypothetical protein
MVNGGACVCPYSGQIYVSGSCVCPAGTDMSCIPPDVNGMNGRGYVQTPIGCIPTGTPSIYWCQ